MQQLLECIPNFSEGQNQQTIDQIKQVIEETPNIKLLHTTSDPDHNRTVITFIGPPKAIFEAAFKMTKKAAELINLKTQKGVHPRIGATDVIPIVPLKGISEKEAIELSKRLAQKISEELKIPTYLYEKSSTRKITQNLANIRKPNFKEPPDFGPKDRHPTAGATVIGVRDFLIAYNINLDTTDFDLAKTIAKEIRQLPNVKALALKLEKTGKIQVSMNLTNFRVTNIDQVYDFIEKRAPILETELIGLIPEEAVTMAMKKLPEICRFKPQQILKIGKSFNTKYNIIQKHNQKTHVEID